MNRIQQIGRWLARPEIVYYTLLWLIVLLVAGTLAQRNIGLYMAQQRYFSSFILWLGPLPFPGGHTTMAVLFTALSAKLIFKSAWTQARLGINIVHVGALMLLFGGFLTAAFSQEGNMIIREGHSSNIVSSYHHAELAFIDASSEDRRAVAVFPEDEFRAGMTLESPLLPFSIEVLDFFHNCQVVQRQGPADETYHGFVKNFDLLGLPLQKENEENRAGLLFRISGVAEGIDGIYGVFEGMPIEQTLTTDHGDFVIDVRREQTVLPFSIHLLDFQKELYAATDMAKSYKSVVMLQDGAIEERRLIHMNHPLRHRNYTFYQASFMEGETETTVLAVVHNAGRLFPYISSLVMCIGLLLHLLSHIPRLIPKKKGS